MLPKLILIINRKSHNYAISIDTKIIMILDDLELL